MKPIAGTLDEMLPTLKAAGFTTVTTAAGKLPLENFDPYGMARIGSPNIGHSARWAGHIWRGRLIEHDGRHFLTDETPATPPFRNGHFPLN